MREKRSESNATSWTFGWMKWNYVTRKKMLMVARKTELSGSRLKMWEQRRKKYHFNQTISFKNYYFLNWAFFNKKNYNNFATLTLIMKEYDWDGRKKSNVRKFILIDLSLLSFFYCVLFSRVYQLLTSRQLCCDKNTNKSLCCAAERRKFDIPIFLCEIFVFFR